MSKLQMFSLSMCSALLIVTAACGKKKDEGGAESTPASKPAGGAPAGGPAAAPAPAPAAANTQVDLDKAGDAWKGFHVKNSVGGEATDSGTGGVIINFTDNTTLQLNPAENRDAKMVKQALAANYKTVTYKTDTADELVYSMVSDMGGTQITGYGFDIVVSAGGKKVECGSNYDDEATVNRMMAVCKSLAK